MPRYVAEVSYNGARFSGWQIQPGLRTVQGELEDALSLLNGSHVDVAGAGRTDTGVHAKGQVCTFDLDKEWEARRLMLAINANIGGGAGVLRLAQAPSPKFHARFDAVSREYVYFIWNSSTIYPMLEPNVCWLKSGGYDWSRARTACNYLLGEHDFGAFCRNVDRPENSVRNIFRATLRKRGNLIRFHIAGNGFLTNMVRIIVGSLEVIARGDKEPEWIAALFKETSVRAECGRTFPPGGLFLWRINYDLPLWG